MDADAPLGDHPLFRVRLWGPFQVEKWEDERYAAVKTTDWGGSNYPRVLLKALLCCPGRRGRREALLDMLWPESESEQATVNLNTATTKLRRLLRPTKGQESLLVTEDDSTIYYLPDRTLLQVDMDIAQRALSTAERCGRTSAEAFPFLEEAVHVFNQGTFLEGEESQWAAGKRGTRERESYRARLWLAEVSQQQGMVGQAETILTTLLEHDPFDEDVLCRLLILFHREGMNRQAFRLYETACHLFAEEGMEFTEATQSVIGHLREGDRSTRHTASDLLSAQRFERDSTKSIPTLQGLFTSFALPGDFLLNREALLDLSLPTSPSFSVPSLVKTDEDVLASLSTVLSGSSAVDEKVLTYFAQQTRLYWRAREETALSAQALYTRVVNHLDDMTMLLARSHLPRLRSSLCETVCRTVLLAGILLYDMGQYARARHHYQIALQAATEANVPVLQAIVWGWISFTWTYTRQYQEAFHCIQQARSFAKQTISLAAQAWLGAIEAEIQAHLQNREACLQAFNEMERGIDVSPSQDIAYLFECNPALFLGYKGVCLQQFYRRHDPSTYGLLHASREALEEALESPVPLKRKLYYLSDLASVYARQGEVEMACAYATQTIPLIIQVGNGSKTIRKHLFGMRALLQPNEHTSSVQALDEQMAPLLLDVQTDEVSSFS